MCLILLAFGALAGCGEDQPGSADGGGSNGGPREDSGVTDGSAEDDASTAGSDASDASSGGDDGGNSSNTSGSSDGGSSGTGGADASTAPASVEAFVAAGFGGFTMLSCDQGRTWIADQRISETDDQHEPFTPKGLVWGKAGFVFYTGWGPEGVARWTADGVHWTPVDLPASYGGVGVTGDEFVILGSRGLLTSKDGKNWEKGGSILGLPDRQTDAFDELWVGSKGTDHWVAKPGEAWTDVSGDCDTLLGGIGHKGGWTAGNGKAVLVGENGLTCVFDLDDGKPIGEGSVGVGDGGKPFFTGDDFLVATGNQLHRSDDGLTWTHHDLPSGVHMDLVAVSAAGTYVGAPTEGDGFYYSEDGENWMEASAPKGNLLTHLEFGYVQSSADCPAP